MHFTVCSHVAMWPTLIEPGRLIFGNPRDVGGKYPTTRKVPSVILLPRLYGCRGSNCLGPRRRKREKGKATVFILLSNTVYFLGIRVLLFVNTSDYMSTSESAGVRIAIHAPTEYPFPDTFGYSAPVGFASSFGMKKVLFLNILCFSGPLANI